MICRTYLTIFSAITLTILAAGCSKGKYSSDGEAIFIAGETQDGAVVENSLEPPDFPDGIDHLGCAACHGSDARGLQQPIPAMGPFFAPDIRWSTLTTQEPPYTEELFAFAIRQGVAPDGSHFHFPMPQWDVSDEQVAEIIKVLRSK
ncbi:MAG: hypothetical protein CL946_10270 [Ectothiorhodospiraceae bacterium]|nr:hypothetical protein [Ectothiorhodospiraceae bacterium]